jgi:hypothetical protein
MSKTSKDHNLNALKLDIKKAAEEVINAKARRLEINAEIAEIRAGMEAKGITKRAFDAAVKYLEQDEEKRAGYDTAYAIAREALGVPVQGDLWDDVEVVAPLDAGTQPDDA